MSSFLPLCSQRLPVPFPVQKRREAKRIQLLFVLGIWGERELYKHFPFLLNASGQLGLIFNSAAWNPVRNWSWDAWRVSVRGRERTPACANRDYPQALLFPGVLRKPGLLGMYVSDYSLPTRSSEGRSRLSRWQGGCSTLCCQGLTCPCCF